MSEIVMFGNGEMAEIAHSYIDNDSPYNVSAFCVHRDKITERTFRGIPVVPFETIQETHPPSRYPMFVPIGAKRMSRLRADIYAKGKEKGYRFISYISSRAFVSPDAAIGDNCFILENNVIQPFVKIGDDVVLWSGNHIGHHGTIEDHVFMASHVVVSGRVTIGAYSYFGVNSAVRDGVTIGEATLVGAGCLILNDTKPKEVYMTQAAEPRKVPSDRVKIV